jgi:hypothetical protein
MTASQRNASIWILGLLEEAIQSADARRSDGKKSRRPRWLDPDRLQNAAYLSGKRGTGKSTLLLSLVDGLTGRSIGDESIDNRLQKLEKRIIPCEPLDMEPLSGDTQLLAAILARINDAVVELIDCANEPIGLLDDDPDESPLLQLRQFQVRVARALDGNLQARKGSLDRDAYASEVIQHEQERLSLNMALNDVLDQTAKAVVQRRRERRELCDKPSSPIDRFPIFLVPIDDLDLNPCLCTELLRLVRSIYAPRLFLLVMGDLDMARISLQLRIAKDFDRISPRDTLLPLTETELRRKIVDVSSRNFQKLVPPGQQSELKSTTLLEGLVFSPFLAPGIEPSSSDAPRSMADLLESIELPYTWFEGKTVEASNLLEFLLRGLVEFRPVGKVDEQSTELTAKLINKVAATPGSSATAQYRAVEIFETTIRRLTDLWFQLDKLVPPPKKPRAAEETEPKDEAGRLHLIQLLTRDIARPNFEQAVREDTSLSNEEQKYVLDADPIDFKYAMDRGHAYASRGVVLSRYWANAPIAHQGDSNETHPASYSDPRIDVILPSVRDRLLFTLAPRDGQTIKVSDSATLANFAFWHDLSSMCHRDGSSRLRTDLMPRHEVSVAWSDGVSGEVSVPWPGMINVTIRSVTTFDTLIDPYFKTCLASIAKETRDNQPAMRELLCAWATLGSAMSYNLGVEYGEGLNSSIWYVPPEEELEDRLAGILNQYAKVASNLAKPSDAYRAKERLERLVQLLMPECGVRINFGRLETKIDGGPFEEYAKRNRGQLIAARQTQLQPFASKGMVDLGNRVSQLAPAEGLFSICPRLEKSVAETRLVPEQLEQLGRQISVHTSSPVQQSRTQAILSDFDMAISLIAGDLEVSSKSAPTRSRRASVNFVNLLRELYRTTLGTSTFSEALEDLSDVFGNYLSWALPTSPGTVCVQTDDRASRIPWESLRIGGQSLGLSHRVSRAPADTAIVHSALPQPRIPRFLHLLIGMRDTQPLTVSTFHPGDAFTGITYVWWRRSSDELEEMLSVETARIRSISPKSLSENLRGS